jgi:hypothetical protein
MLLLFIRMIAFRRLRRRRQVRRIRGRKLRYFVEII